MTLHARTRGAKWAQTRRIILARDNYACQSCKAHGKLVAAKEIDHVKPLAHGGTDAHANLTALCHDCHTDKTNKQRGATVRVRTGIDGWPVSA